MILKQLFSVYMILPFIKEERKFTHWWDEWAYLELNFGLYEIIEHG